MNRPPGGPPPEPPPPSRLRPPWRGAPPGEHPLIVLWAVAGFLLPWLVLVLGVALGFLGHPGAMVACIGVTLVLDTAGFVVMLVANPLRVRGAAYGAFAGCLTHIISVAIVVVVFFGWCVSMLNKSY